MVKYLFLCLGVTTNFTEMSQSQFTQDRNQPHILRSLSFPKDVRFNNKCISVVKKKTWLIIWFSYFSDVLHQKKFQVIIVTQVDIISFSNKPR